MQKFLAVLKREYKKVVFSWTFLITTFLMPFIASVFVVVPMLIFSIEGESTRIAIADLNGNVESRLRDNLSPTKIAEKAKKAAEESLTDITASQDEKLKRSAEQLGGTFTFVPYEAREKAVDEIRRELSAKVAAGELEAFLIIPKDINSEAKFGYYSRKAGDFVINSTLQDALNEAVRSQRLAEANISEEMLKDLSKKVSFEVKPLTETGDVKEQDSGPWTAFIVAMLIYIVLAIYGQAIMSAIVEEKETRISEVLFSSARPFELMMGKLVGVGLAGLTQLAIWISTVAVLVTFGLVSAAASGFEITLPEISIAMVVYFFIFFLLGYFIYATIYALIGSMVTSMQEGGQFALPPILILLVGLYFCFAVIRDPNSAFAFWVSIAPFFAPIVMPVRIVSDMPPFWQIALAIVLNGAAIVGLTWAAARVYRVGMLMYGKRATIPEVLKWIRQS
ncbi:MAG: ABC transporter permease [Acidobacteria bacterium]|nr:MAG: ABC transporter permease [Acidobacteriota bacterium]REK02107.1 MAG: ABC transporter permease [Acidobacteriota bacterium]REK14091.1 MAG: ABC transporter permease [Acidobacteriota bacterium]REK42086.1 MAG: ABC transporter permease [Acidobacteriota bacterium]